MTFRVGQKVVCVEPGRTMEWAGEHQAVVGHVYTVRAVRLARNRVELTILVNELINPIYRDGDECGFYASRFRPIVERKTDISCFTEILRKASKPARVPSVAITQHQRGTENV